MSELYYENQGTNTYLVYQIEETDELDTLSLGMLKNNAIPGFAPVLFTQMDTAKYIKYNVSAKVSAAQLFAGEVNKKRLIGVFLGVVDAMLSAEDYMIDPGSILLDLDYIFADVTTCDTVVVCLPIMNVEHSNPEPITFFRNILVKTQFAQMENRDYVAHILSFLNGNPVLSLPGFKQLLETLARNEESSGDAPQRRTETESYQASPAAERAAALSNGGTQPVYSGKPQAVVPRQETPPVTQNQAPASQAAAQPGQPVIPASAQSQGSSEKPVSKFRSLFHSKKAQGEAKKGSKSTPAASSKSVPNQTKGGFAVPGKQNSSALSFEVPNQQPSQAQQPAPPAAPAPPQPAAASTSQTVAQGDQQPQSAATRTSVHFGETVSLRETVGETTVLSTASDQINSEPYLVRIKTGEKFKINKPLYRIGKEKSYVDCFIGDNTAISRSHANIERQKDEFFIEDTNSTNHTYVNGTMVPSGQKTALTHGTRIRLANEDFEFRLY